MLRLLGRRNASLRRQLSTDRAVGFHGVWPIMVTPFSEDESLDLEAFSRSVRFMAEAGAAGCTITGVLGESNRLTDAEREKLVRCAVAAAPPNFPICVGTSHSGTLATVALSQMAQDLGAQSVMVTPSKEAAPQSNAQLRELYARIAMGCPGLPIVLQDHPASTQVHMSADLLVDICAGISSVQCIKLEATPTPAKIATIRQAWARGRAPAASECTILTGLGGLYAGFDLEQGTEGFMTGFAFPEILVAMNEAAQRGDLNAAHALYRRFLSLLVFEQQPGVAVRKEIYRLRGLVSSATVRHPGAQLSPVAAVALREELNRSLPGVDITRPIAQDFFA